MELPAGTVAAGVAALRVSTDAMPASSRVAIWREAFAREFLRLDIEPREPERFKADATIKMLPGLKIASCAISASYWRRTRRMIDPGPEEMGFVLGWHGPARLSQRGHAFELGFGDAAVINNSEPAELSLPRAMGRHVGLIVPLQPLAESIRDRGALPRRIERNNEALRLLSGYLGALSDNLTLLNLDLCRAAVTHVHDLIALAIGATRDGAEIAQRRGVRAARLHAVKGDVLAHLGSRDLSVASVAKRQSVTPRYIHMLFEAEGTTFSEFVLGERLAYARRLLADLRHDHQTIAAIAYDAGFGDLSYFNRAFRRRFDMTPSEARACGAGGRSDG